MPRNTVKMFNRQIQNLLSFSLLLVFVLLVNLPAISFDFLCPEQIVVYIANQNIHSISDIINIYLHPQMLQHNIPFFRPSGHFLIYQIFAPLFGWQNTKALIVINLIFLTLAGYVMVKIYELLFTSL